MSAPKPLPPVHRIRELLTYDPLAGRMHWRNDYFKMRAGEVAGCLADTGYWVIKIEGKRYRRSRLAWAHYHGKHPEQVIHHLDYRKKNDRITNLRDISQEENLLNAGEPIGPDPDPDVFVGMKRIRRPKAIPPAPPWHVVPLAQLPHLPKGQGLVAERHRDDPTRMRYHCAWRLNGKDRETRCFATPAEAIAAKVIQADKAGGKAPKQILGGEGPLPRGIIVRHTKGYGKPKGRRYEVSVTVAGKRTITRHACPIQAMSSLLNIQRNINEHTNA